MLNYAAEQATTKISLIYKKEGLVLTKIRPGGCSIQNVFVCSLPFIISFSVTVDKVEIQVVQKYFRCNYVYICYMNYHNLKSFISIVLTIFATQKLFI